MWHFCTQFYLFNLHEPPVKNLCTRIKVITTSISNKYSCLYGVEKYLATFGSMCIMRLSVRAVFFNLLRFTAPLRAKIKFGGTSTWKKWFFLAPLVISIYKKTEKTIFGGTPTLSHGTLVCRGTLVGYQWVRDCISV